MVERWLDVLVHHPTPLPPLPPARPLHFVPQLLPSYGNSASPTISCCELSTWKLLWRSQFWCWAGSGGQRKLLRIVITSAGGLSLVLPDDPCFEAWFCLIQNQCWCNVKEADKYYLQAYQSTLGLVDCQTSVIEILQRVESHIWETLTGGKRNWSLTHSTGPQTLFFERRWRAGVGSATDGGAGRGAAAHTSLLQSPPMGRQRNTKLLICVG